MTALQTLRARTGAETFTVREVHAEMVTAGSAYAKATAFKTMQRMKEEPVRRPFVRLERVGREGFRLVGADLSNLSTSCDPESLHQDFRHPS
ncbi:MAG TPA: hypothetical protein VNG13_04055 [Mycobacteriales bacterium]|nr:hypothetical protein [Mycobacteriales bacterium]